jgi:hypothetical protein
MTSGSECEFERGLESSERMGWMGIAGERDTVVGGKSGERVVVV